MTAQANVTNTLTNVRYFSDDDLNPNHELHFGPGAAMRDDRPTIRDTIRRDRGPWSRSAISMVLAIGGLTLRRRRR